MSESDNPDAEPLDGEVLDDAPEWLGDEGRTAWRSVHPMLRRSGLLKSQDRLALARYCDYTARWLKVRNRIDAEDGRGETYWTRSKHGKMLRVNPDMVVLLKLEDKLQSLEDRFGLAPATRLKILKDLAASNGSLPFDQPDQPTQPGRSSPVGLLRSIPGGKH